ncbi:MAG: helix-turn-helix domain-containing protein [Solobacterium sp.]|jgi:repressor LexA|nr:helix-turn-helix domain-containing protein [Solobacterium sp.]
MELKDVILEYKEKTGVTDSEIARRTGVSRSTACRWASGEIRRVSGETAARLDKMLGYPVQTVLKGQDLMQKLPVLGYVKAGYDLFAEENYLGEEEASLQDCRKGDYYLKVTGSSMIGDGIMDGSLVLVRQTDTIESGKIGVVLVGDEVTVKRVIYKESMMILEAANPDVENRYFTAKEIRSIPVRILGQVISCKTIF